MEARLNEKAISAQRPFRPAERSSKAYEVEVEGQRFPRGDKRNHPSMRLFRVHPLRNETETFPNPEHMGVYREGLPSKAKKEEAMNGLGPDPFQAPHRFMNLAGFHLFQDGET